MHYYQFHIGDYASHTRHLSLMEDLAYRRLLDFYYLHEAPIRQRDIARQIGMRDYEQDVLTVLNEFFMSTEDGFVSPRADKEIEHYHSKVEQASRAGKASAQRRSNKRSTDVRTDVQPTNNHKPITNNQINTPDGVDELVWQDWISFRKKRRAPVTDRVVEGLVKEGKIAGMTLNQVLTECVVNGWQSFKGEWVLAKQKTKFDVATVTTPTPPNYDAALRKIEEDSKRAAPIPDNIREKMAELLGGRK